MLRDEVNVEDSDDAAGENPYAVEAVAMARSAPVAVLNFIIV